MSTFLPFAVELSALPWTTKEDEQQACIARGTIHAAVL